MMFLNALAISLHVEIRMYVTTDAETRCLNRKKDSGLKNIGPNCFRLHASQSFLPHTQCRDTKLYDLNDNLSWQD